MPRITLTPGELEDEQKKNGIHPVWSRQFIGYLIQANLLKKVKTRGAYCFIDWEEFLALHKYVSAFNSPLNHGIQTQIEP